MNTPDIIEEKVAVFKRYLVDATSIHSFEIPDVLEHYKDSLTTIYQRGREDGAKMVTDSFDIKLKNTHQQHKPDCGVNISCLVHHADGVCNHPKYGKCTCGSNTHQQPSSKEWEKRVVELQFKTMLSRDMPEVAKKYHQEMIDFIQSLLTSHSEAIRERVEFLRKEFVPADKEWFGAEDYSEGEFKLVPAKDPRNAMYCLTCERFLPEEGCICGMVHVDDILALLTDDKNI